MSDSKKAQNTRFVVFCLEAFKRNEHLTGATAADLFIRHGVVEYLEHGYDVLHTLEEAALVEDIRDYLQHRHQSLKRDIRP